MTSALKYTAKGAAAGVAASTGTAVGLFASGLTTTSVMTGSVAAGVQAGAGNLAMGGAFTLLKMVGVATSLPVAAGIGAVSGLALYTYRLFKPNK